MECPYCDSLLEYESEYGYLAPHQTGEVLGYIYKCPKSEGFDSEEEANEYLNHIGETIESIGVESWEELTCHSSVFHVCGSFYTDKYGALHECYPC